MATRRSAKHRNNWSRPTATRTRQTTKVLHASPVARPNSARLVLAPPRELLDQSLPAATPPTSGPETRSTSQRPALSRTTAAVSQMPIQRPVPPQRRWLHPRPLRRQAQQRRKNRGRTKTHACLTLSTRNCAQCRRGANSREFWKLSPTLRQCVHQQHMSPNSSFLEIREERQATRLMNPRSSPASTLSCLHAPLVSTPEFLAPCCPCCSSASLRPARPPGQTTVPNHLLGDRRNNRQLSSAPATGPGQQHTRMLLANFETVRPVALGDQLDSFKRRGPNMKRQGRTDLLQVRLLRVTYKDRPHLLWELLAARPHLVTRATCAHSRLLCKSRTRHPVFSKLHS